MIELDIKYYLALKNIKNIYNRIRYLISQKSGITYVISHNYARIKVDSIDFLPLEKTLALHNVKSVLIKIKISTTVIYS